VFGDSVPLASYSNIERNPFRTNDELQIHPADRYPC